MIVNINPRGHSFKGVTAYLMHDRGAETSERVLWTSTHNLHTDDIEKASRFMAWTDMNRDDLRENNVGRKATAGNVYHYSLSMNPGKDAERDAMEAFALSSVDRLKLNEHQFYLVAHSDTEHRHVHVVVNLTHPETGKIARLRADRKVLDRWANDYEKEHGIDCENRAKKYEAWEQDRPAFKAKERREEYQRVVSEAFQLSDSGKAFSAALEQSELTLARGNRRGLVVVDRAGEVYALNRLVELDCGTAGRAKTKLINDRVKDVDREALPMADQLSADRQSYDRDAAETDRQNALAEAAEDAARKQAEQEKKDADALLQRRRMEEARAEAIKLRDERLGEARDAFNRNRDEARQRLELEAITQAREQARADLDSLSGFWARIFKRRAIAEAKTRHEQLEQQLADRTARYEAEVQALQERQRDAMRAAREEHRQRLQSYEPEPSPLREAWEKRAAAPPSPTEPERELTPEERREATKQAFLDRMAQERDRDPPERDRGPERE